MVSGEQIQNMDELFLNRTLEAAYTLDPLDQGKCINGGFASVARLTRALSV